MIELICMTGKVSLYRKHNSSIVVAVVAGRRWRKGMVVTMGMNARDGAADVKSGRAEMQAWVMWRLKAGLLGIAVLLLWCAAAAASAKVGAAPRRKGASHPHHTLPPTVTALLKLFFWIFLFSEKRQKMGWRGSRACPLMRGRRESLRGLAEIAIFLRGQCCLG